MPGDSSMVEVALNGVRMRASAPTAKAIDMKTSPIAIERIRGIGAGTKDDWRIFRLSRSGASARGAADLAPGSWLIDARAPRSSTDPSDEDVPRASSSRCQVMLDRLVVAQ
jgi:hypothetical protein